VGSGTGAIALAVKRRRPYAQVWATDTSDAAVALTRANAGRLDLALEVRHGDLLDPLPPELVGAVDLLVSNPPYVTEEEFEDLPAEVKGEPVQALVGGTSVHRRLLGEAERWLAPGGWLVVEIGATQGPEVRSAFRRSLQDVDVVADLAGRDRVVFGRKPVAGDLRTSG
jgi:release factor glutamine methyltransferase